MGLDRNVKVRGLNARELMIHPRSKSITADTTMIFAEGNTTFDNTGASEAISLLLPEATQNGLRFGIDIMVSQYLGVKIPVGFSIEHPETGEIIAGDGASIAFKSNDKGAFAIFELDDTTWKVISSSGNWRQPVAKVADYDLKETDSGGVFTNEGASGAIVFDLPVAKEGLKYHFRVMVAQALRVNPQDDEQVSLPSTGALQVAGKYIEADAVGESVTVEANSDGKWFVTKYIGTWTAES
jgi:hypothetical protein